MHANRRKFLGILVVAIVISLGAAIAVANLCPRARASNREPALAQTGWRLAQPITYENLTIFPVVTSQDADTSEFATLDQALASGDAVVTRGKLRLPPHTRGHRAARLLHRRAGESTGLHQSRQAPSNSSGRGGRLRRQAGPHHRQGPHRAGRSSAAAARCLLRRARALDRRLRAIQRRAHDGPSQRARKSRRRSGPVASMGRRAR